jgi:hypothetical protein
VLRAPVAIALTFALACSSKPDAPRAQPPAEGSGSDGAGDRAVEEVETPGSGARIDRPAVPPARQGAARASRPIDIVLRSSPAGATAAVDGVPIGPTPTYWSGDANGREHEFTFVLPGYAFARYRFVPITSGVVHARLEVLTDDTDAGVPPEMMRVPDAPPEPRPRTPVGTTPAGAPSQNGHSSPTAAPSAPSAPLAPSSGSSAPSNGSSTPSSAPSAPSAPTPPAPNAPAPSTAPSAPEAAPPADATPGR